MTASFCVSCGKIIVAGPNPVADACGACFREAAAAGKTKVARRFTAPYRDIFTPAEQAKIDSELCAICWQRYDQHDGREEHRFQDSGVFPPDRAINDALGLSAATEPIAACIDLTALPPAGGHLVGTLHHHTNPISASSFTPHRPSAAQRRSGRGRRGNRRGGPVARRALGGDA